MPTFICGIQGLKANECLSKSGSRQKGSNKKPSSVKHVSCIIAKSSKTARIIVGKVGSRESNMLLHLGANMSMVNAQFTPQLAILAGVIDFTCHYPIAEVSVVDIAQNLVTPGKKLVEKQFWYQKMDNFSQINI